MQRYEPSSDFLKGVISDEIPFEGQIGAYNLARLVGLTRDTDRANRDWATFLLSQTDFDNAAIREALLDAASDLDFDVRCEAVLGLAQRNVSEASLLVQNLLREQCVGRIAVEAAGFVACANLLPLLTELRSWWDVDTELLEAAITACETGVKFDR